MKTLFITIAAAFLITGCNNVSQEADEVLNETEDVVDEAAQEADQIINNAENELDQTVEEMSQAINEFEEQADHMVIGEGEVASINKDAFLALTEEAYENMYGFIEVQNANQVIQFKEANKITELDLGTRVKVMETNATEVKVEVIESGETGYIHRALLSQVG